MEDSLRMKLIEQVKKSIPGIPDEAASKILDIDLSLRRLAHLWMRHVGIKIPEATPDGPQFESDYTAYVIGPTLEVFIDRLGKFITHLPPKGT